jgi:glycosyltransferase involved in cell wall biosynthesis
MSDLDLRHPEVVLPALDEAAAIPWVLASLPDGWTAIVVDNGSTDGSADIARRHGARVVCEPRRGFGAACYAGLVAATADVVCFMDCDGSLAGADLHAVAAPVIAGDADLVLGARRPSPGAWPVHLRVANRVLARRVNRRCGARITDLGPMRAARRDALFALELRDRRSGWPLEMVVRAAEAGWRIDEVAVGYAPRVGRSKVTGTVGGALRAVRDMQAVLT